MIDFITDFKKLREKWNIPLFLHWREVCTLFVLLMCSNSSWCCPTGDDGEWNLCVFSAVWKGLEQCWMEGIYLPPLVHRFWKLTLQILARLCSHLKSTLTGKVCVCVHINMYYYYVCVCVYVCALCTYFRQ